jgi:phosphatidylserine/phosphatidylglycerophosphate/cardiolipin synthase-like enzyme
MKKGLLLIFLAVVLIACKSTGNAHKIELKEASEPIEVCFTPQENCEEFIIGILDDAQNSIHCAFFDINLKNLTEFLDMKSRSLDVKLVMDSDNYDNQTMAIPLVLDNKNQLSHNKFCIVDEKTMIGGSFNPTTNQLLKDNNNVVAIHSRLLAENYEQEFNELWNRRFGEGSEVFYPSITYNAIQIENYFCPEDKCEAHVVNTILSAQSSIYFMIFAFTDEDVADAILFSNVSDIKGVMDKMQASQRYSQYKRLKEFGIDVKMENSSGLLHHKVFIIDNETVITGSYNPTAAADNKNDENMLIIRDKRIAGKFLAEFEKLFIG